MKNFDSNIINQIMQAFDEGVETATLIRQFPEQQTVIEEIAKTRSVLFKSVADLPVPVIKPHSLRLSTGEGSIKSPYINNIITSMNYKIAVPVLMLGLVVVSGGMLLSPKKNASIVQNNTADETELSVNNNDQQPTDEIDETVNGELDNNPVTVPDKPPTPTKPTTNNSNVNDILANFSANASSEQTVLADDGLNSEQFAHAGLSDFENDTYDY